MRTVFVKSLTELARTEKRIFLLVADLGYSAIEPFAEEFPSRFLNVGVAEQNMTSIAAGLALWDKIVFAYSIANFPTFRCLEQIRNDICYHNANVKIVTVGGGLAYGALGMTHHGTEDLAIMRTLPNMAVIAPADPVEVALATRAVAEWPGPCYLRLGKAGEARIHQAQPAFRLGLPLELRRGEDLVILATGAVVANALLAAEKLSAMGLAAGVYSVHTIKPLEAESLSRLIQDKRLIVTVEEHSVVGGLGSAVAEVLTEIPIAQPCLKRIALPDAFCGEVGSQEFLRRNNLSVDSLVAQIHDAFFELRGVHSRLKPEAHAASVRRCDR